MYSKVEGAYRAKEVKKALNLLCDAGIIKRVSHTATNGVDYVIARDLKVLPIECKAGVSGKMKRYVDIRTTSPTKVQNIRIAKINNPSCYRTLSPKAEDKLNALEQPAKQASTDKHDCNN